MKHRNALAIRLSRDFARAEGLKETMNQQVTERHKTVLSRLRLALAGTFLLSFAVRLMAPGVILFLFGWVLLLIALVHLIVHVRAMKRVPFTAARYRFMIWCSHLLFFLGFAFQLDGPDASYVRAPILFWLLLTPTDIVAPISNMISVGSLILLSVSWLFLESVPMPRKPSR